MEYQLKTPINGVKKVNVYTDAPLGKGATATVYKSSINGTSYAAKIFHDKSKLDLKKIGAMLANPPSNLTGVTAGIEYPQYSWPISIIQDSAGQAVGYVMPLIDQQESFTLDHYYDKNLGKKLNSPEEVALSYKIEIAANLSRLIADLHSHQHCFVDCKPQNIRVFKRTHAVTLLDCDGFSINGNDGKRFPAELLSTDYIAPEAFRGHKSAKDLGEYHDRYALATIIFQLLNGGIHPFQGIPTGQVTAATNDEKAAQGLYPHGLVPDPRIKSRPQSVHNCLDDSTRELFDKAFMGLPRYRPTSAKWAEHLDSLLQNKQLTRCDQHPYDIRHMRFMDKPCPECQLQKLQSSETHPQKSSIKLPPSSGANYSSPLPQASSGTMDPGIKALIWGVVGAFVAVLIAAMIFSNNSSNSSQPVKPPQPVKPVQSDAKTSQTVDTSNGYLSVYWDEKSNAFSWATGYPTQSEADENANQSCSTRGAVAPCKRLIGGPYKCLAVYQDPVGGWIYGSVGETLSDVKKRAKAGCEKASGAICSLPPEGATCVKPQNEPAAKVESKQKVNQNPSTGLQIQNLSSEEKESLEATCSQDRNLGGNAGYNACIERNLNLLSIGPRLPNLNALSYDQKSNIEASCSQDKFLKGPAAYAACARKVLSQSRN